MPTYTRPRNPWLYPLPFGAEPSGGIGTEGDLIPRVTQTADNVDLNQIWQTMQAALAQWNSHRSAVVDILSYWHTSVADAISQGLNEDDFEQATEFGEPESLRPPTAHVLMGYDFNDFDRAARYTWRFLRDADQRQVLAIHDGALNSDNRLVTGTILARLFSPGPVVNSQGIQSYGLWSGADGMVPPDFMGRSFDRNHTHYLVSGSEEIDSGDLENAVKHIREHGYGLTDSNQALVALVNESEAEVIQSFRANEQNKNNAIARWDFIPADNQPTFVLQGGGQLVGNQPSGEVFKLPRVGVYGPISIVESSFVPSGYIAVVATAGPKASSNVVGVREHTTAAYRGLRQLPGNTNGYPLIESFYSRSFGTGVRHRGAAVVTQLAAAGPYTAPIIEGSGL